MRKSRDPNQIDLFAGTDFAAPSILPKKVEVQPILKKGFEPRKSNEDMVLWFAKNCKQSLAFLECVLRGVLPGDYHGTKLWMRRWRGLWVNELVENADYWIEKGYKIIEQKQAVYIIKLR